MMWNFNSVLCISLRPNFSQWARIILSWENILTYVFSLNRSSGMGGGLLRKYSLCKVRFKLCKLLAPQLATRILTRAIIKHLGSALHTFFIILKTTWQDDMDCTPVTFNKMPDLGQIMELVMIALLIRGGTLPALVFVHFWSPHVPGQTSIFLPEVTSVKIEVCWNVYKPTWYIHLIIELEFDLFVSC